MQNEDINKIDGYALPTPKEVIFDTEKGAVVEEDLAPLELLKLSAEKAGIKIKDPNPNCKKCYGRGYVGFESGSKIPRGCNCLFTKEDLEQQRGNILLNKKTTRVLMDMNIRHIKSRKENQVKSMGLVCVDKNLFKNKKGIFFVWDGTSFVKKA